MRRVVVLALVVIVILVIGISAAVGPSLNKSPSLTSSDTSSISSSSTSTASSSTSTSPSLTSTSSGTTLQTTTTFALRPCNCSANLRSLWQTYSTLDALSGASASVIVGNVSGVTTEGVNDGLGPIPVTVYNVTISKILVDTLGLTIGDWVYVGQVGGTIGSANMSVIGYPTLTVGGSYVFFLNLAGSLGNMYGATLITTGGPQGLFYIRSGNVYSVDNLFPQTDSWLPVKVNGIPLSQFSSEVQATIGSTSVSATNSTSIAS